MRLPSVVLGRARPTPCRPDASLLGRDHPYVRTSESLDSLARQWLAVAMLLAGSAAADAGGVAGAGTLAVSAGVVLLALTAVAGALRQRRRERSIDLILDGREGLPLATVQRERQRLLDRRTRERLSAALEDLVRAARRRRNIEALAGGPIFHVPVVLALAHDLRGVAALLRTDAPVGARGVALLEHLLTRGDSPLYGRHAGALREELRRVRYLLGADRANAS